MSVSATSSLGANTRLSRSKMAWSHHDFRLCGLSRLDSLGMSQDYDGKSVSPPRFRRQEEQIPSWKVPIRFEELDRRVDSADTGNEMSMNEMLMIDNSIFSSLACSYAFLKRL
jgi:hypothetical protein